ncbi:hypothetical protein PLESTM_000290100 [Pleodorina starrii]|nr:hypothetical protein PLESTM_000290100 [Pleodorina starrii]
MGCNASLVQLQAALESLNGHDSEGVLGVLLEHPAMWLDTYRGFRGLTAQLISVSCFVREAAQRGQADDADEALQDSIKALMGTCTRAREAAHLMGRELPEFARAAAADGWSAGRLRLALDGGAAAAVAAVTVTLRSGTSSPCRRSGCGQGTCGCGGGGVASAEAPAAVLAAASAALQQQQQQQPASQQQQQQRMGLLQRIGKAAACSTPRRRSSTGSGSSASLDRSLAGRMDDAACALITRIQDLILYDSEVDHLEQDRAYLLQRVSHLLEFCDGADGGGDAAAAAQSAAASLVQSEVLLAAVESRLRALEELSDTASGSEAAACKEAGEAVALVCAGGGGLVTSGRSPEKVDRLVDPEDLYDDVRKRRPGLRWLPLCFVGA